MSDKSSMRSLFKTSRWTVILFVVILGAGSLAAWWMIQHAEWDWAATSALPIGLILILLIVLISWIMVYRPGKSTLSVKPVQRRLMVPLAVVLLILVGGFATIMVDIQQIELNQSSREIMESVSYDLKESLAVQSQKLSLIGDILLHEENLINALKAQDKNHLLAEYEPIFKQLLVNDDITHFYFQLPDRVNLLRVHKPSQSGDLINRFTTLEAERTRQTASGIELGPLGTFTLRVVQPVFDGDTLIGYLELGKEIEDVLKDIAEGHDLELAVVIQKNVLDRTKWETGMEVLDRTANWNRFQNDALIYSSLPQFPPECDRFVDESGHTDKDVTTEVTFNGKSWRVLIDSLSDVSGAEVGDLLVMYDISTAKAAFHRLLIVSIGGALFLLASLLGFLYVLLLRTDQGIRLQQANLQESKDRFEQLAEQSNAFTWEVDADGLYTFVSHVVHQVVGYRPEELVGRKHFYDLHPEAGREAFKSAALGMFEKKEPFAGLENLIQPKDGPVIWVSTNGLPLLSADGSLRGYRGSDTDITERKLAVEALRSSEDYVRTVLESTVDGILAVDAQGNVRHANRRFAEMWHIPRELSESGDDTRLLNHVLEQLTDPKAFISKVEQLYGSLEKDIDTLLFKDGRVFERFSCPLRRNGILDGRVWSFRDITERKQAENAVRESEAKFRSVIEQSNDGIYILFNNRFDLINKSFVELTGITFEDTEDPSFNFLETLTPESRILVEERSEMRKRGEQPPDVYEFSLIRKGGDIRLVQASLSEIDYRNSKAIIGILRDITESRQAEEALLQGERRFRSIIESTSDGIIISDISGNISMWNDGAEKIFCYTADEIIGEPITVLMPEEYRDLHAEGFNHLIKTGVGKHIGQTLEIEGLRKDGTSFPLELSLSSWQSGEERLVAAFTRDITERKEHEAELREMNEHLEHQTMLAVEMTSQAEMASKAKSEFLANMSHEIRTPMNGVIGMNGLLLDTDLDDEQRRFANTVKASAEALLELINDILDFSKIEAGKMEMEILDFDLRSTLGDFSELMALRAHEKGLEFICAASPETPTYLRGDPGRLRQILLNLTGNSIKFTSEGEIAVLVTLESETDVEVVLRFSVNDTGIGIPAHKQSQLFHQFTQVDASTTRKYGGTGLGLAISKQLSEMMGGEIGVNSVDGEGSEFWFTAHFEKQPEKQRDLSVPADFSGARILVVDDNATNREILLVQLSAWGARPDEVPDGETALCTLHEAVDAGDPYRVAILDMQMPGMDGELLGATIKADPMLSDTLMIMMTSFGKRGDARRFEEIGFAAYFAKPVRQSDLFDCLALVLSGKKRKTGQSLVTRHSIREIRRDTSVRILLAEDNITNQQVALGILKKLGLSAEAVGNGTEAINALETIPYDLVLMDVHMPEMDGLEATIRIRNSSSKVRNHNIPIIAMTANAMQGDRDECLNAGMNDYLSKPVTPAELADMLDKWLPKDKVLDNNTEKDNEVPDAKSTHDKSVDNAGPVFDKAGMLQRLMGDEDLAQIVIQGFREDIPNQIQILKDFLDSGDASGAERQAHTIKGASATIGGEVLRAEAYEMEKLAKAGDLITVKDKLPELEFQFSKLIATIDKVY